jgi:LysR family transcriptional regulator, glycine cleavage system transcriptional activator
VYGTPPDSALASRHLFDEQLTPVCSSSLTLHAPADLRHQLLLHPTRDERDWKTWLNAAGIDPTSVGKGQHFETLDMAMSMASQGTGVAIGDWSLIGDDLNAGRLVMPFELKVKTGLGYYLVFPQKPGPSAKLQELTGWLVEQAQAR